MARNRRRIETPEQDVLYRAFAAFPEFPVKFDFYARADGIREPTGSADDEYHALCRDHNVIPYQELVFRSGEEEVIDYFGGVHLRERDHMKLRRPDVRTRIIAQTLAGGRIHAVHLLFDESDLSQQAGFTTLLEHLAENNYHFMFGEARFGAKERTRTEGHAELYLSERGLGLDFTRKKQHIADWFDEYFT
ncbi:hypothetical protein D6789_02435 [Candidatus Woesearchaeota archaeon]|nr:MAG: hypothetical protein D6789_02435 [Candidatus Woesearchaeota archaeon]